MRSAEDPPKWKIRVTLLTELYSPSSIQFNSGMVALIDENCFALQQEDILLHGKVIDQHTHPSFAFNGKFYSLKGEGPAVRNRVHSSMVEKVRKYIEFYNSILITEHSLVAGYLNSMLSFFEYPGDWIHVLPDSLKPVLKKIADDLYADPWQQSNTIEGYTAFIKHRQSGFNLICERLATNLIIS